MFKVEFIKTVKPFNEHFTAVFGEGMLSDIKNSTTPLSRIFLGDKPSSEIYIEIGDVSKPLGDTPVDHFIKRMIEKEPSDVLSNLSDKSFKHYKASQIMQMYGYHIVNDTEAGDSFILVTTGPTTVLRIWLNPVATFNHDVYIENNKRYYGGIESFFNTFIGLNHKEMCTDYKSDGISKLLTHSNVTYRAYISSIKDSFVLKTHTVMKWDKQDMHRMLHVALALHTVDDYKFTANLSKILLKIAELLPESKFENRYLKTVEFDIYYMGVGVGIADNLEFFITDIRNKELFLSTVLKV
jgi:hypothetical protein